MKVLKETIPSFSISPLISFFVSSLIEQRIIDDICAFEFLKRVAEISEKSNHHPHIYNSYNKVVIKLITHDLDSISSKDFDLALEIDKIK